MKIVFLLIASFIAVCSGALAGDGSEHDNRLEDLAKAIELHDVEGARAIFPGEAKVISFFNGEYYLDSFEVMIENFKDSQLLESEEDVLAYSICGGAATYSIQYRQIEDGSFEIFYGTSDIPLPPVPFSARSSWKHCTPPIRYVGGF